MYKDARNKAGLSRDEAAFRLHIGSRTLTNYEHGQTIVPPEIALQMSEVYQDPTIPARYCSEQCPIGQIFAHSVPEHNNLCQAVLGVLNEHNDVSKMRDSLMAIAADGVIDQDELPAFENIMTELLDLQKKIEELKLQTANVISIPAMMQKRKRPLAAAR